jgi:hypothetical protein
MPDRAELQLLRRPRPDAIPAFDEARQAGRPALAGHRQGDRAAARRLSRVGPALEPPFVVANLVLDGSDQTFIHLVSGCKNEDVQIGMRVKAVWKDKSEWDYSMDNIAYFAPTGEPNVDIVALKASRLEEAKRYVKAKVETKNA